MKPTAKDIIERGVVIAVVMFGGVLGWFVAAYPDDPRSRAIVTGLNWIAGHIP